MVVVKFEVLSWEHLFRVTAGCVILKERLHERGSHLFKSVLKQYLNLHLNSFWSLYSFVVFIMTGKRCPSNAFHAIYAVD